MNSGGGAAITACDSSIFLMLRKGRRELYPYALSDISRKDYVEFTDVMKPYLYPREGGVDSLELYMDGFGRFLRDRGETALTMSPWPGEKSLSETKEIVKKQIDGGWLIPSLTLLHMRSTMQKFVWHWYLLNGYHEQGETFLVKTVTYGTWQWVNLAELWDTGCDRKGGLVLYG